MTKTSGKRWMVGTVLAVIVLLVVAAFLSPVQTAVARQVLADQLGADAELGRITVRPGAVELANLTVQRGPIAVKVPALRAEMSLWRLLMSQPRVDRLEAKGWELRWDGSVELAEAATPPRVDGAGWSAVLGSLTGAGEVPPGALEALAQILAQPVPLAVGEVDLEGNAAWRQAGPGADGSAQVRIRGRGPQAGRDNILSLEVVAVGAQATARGIQGLDIRTELATRLDTDARLEQLGFRNTLATRRDDLSEVREYGLDLTLDQTGGVPRLDLVWREGDNALVTARLANDSAAQGLAGQWEVATNSSQVSNLMLGRELPEFDFSGVGTLAAPNDLSGISVEGDLEIMVSDLSSVGAEWAAIGQMNGQMSFAMRQGREDTRFTDLTLRLEGAAPIVEARLLQGVELGRDAYELRVESPEDPVWQLQLLGLPPAWAQPWLEPWIVDAQPIQGGLLGLVTPQGLRVVTSDPIRLKDLSFAKAGRTFVDRGELEIELGAEVTPEGWQVELGRVALARDGREIALLQARGGQLQVDEGVAKMVGRLDVDVAAITEWPALADQLSLESGHMTAEFGLGLGERLSVATALTLSELSAAASTVNAPQIEADARLDLLADGVVEVHLPARLISTDRNSDFTFNLRAEPQSGGWEVAGSLSGAMVHAENLQGLLELLPDSNDEIAQIEFGAAKLSPVQATPARAAWTGLTGSVQANIGQLLLAGAPAIQRLSGEILIEESSVRMPTFAAEIGEGGAALINASLEFKPDERNSYQGLASVGLTDVAVDPWLRWLDPAQVPVLTGRMNVDARWESAVDDLDRLVEAGTVSAQISSAGGEIRALGVQVESYIQTGQTVASLGAIFGALTGNEDIQQHASRIQSVTSAAEMLSLIAFDQMNLQIDRIPNGDILLSDISLISPSLRLLGEGRITYRPGTPVWLQPLEITLNLSARDQLGVALQRLRLVRGEADTLGYLPLIDSFTLDGSLANIGTNELQRLLVGALQRR